MNLGHKLKSLCVYAFEELGREIVQRFFLMAQERGNSKEKSIFQNPTLLQYTKILFQKIIGK